ncbi:hypothetical protein [Streptacidiphilus jiangxiensis]|uniref:Secreted protein n=1 Tax=Streptacidiphilus jiangxiensis TaxID=235985 RepID=A0A1H7P004_STRJI|nr:hypothetical protein [Streptacidiphilus jiangxiensis]SEL28909.1 hypothetical protein SAMN05414137_107147 [Streptacidiphilus jiangxiensis]
MPVPWVVILVVLLVAAFAAAVADASARRTRRLKERFGSEYGAAVTAHQGRTRRAQSALLKRERRLDALPVRRPDPARAEQVRVRWRDLQRQFVDEPAAVLARAVRALEELLDDMGLPAEREDREALLRFRGAQVLQSYRRARGVTERSTDGTVSTEELREGFVSARSVCEALLGAEDLPSTEGEDARLVGGRVR